MKTTPMYNVSKDHWIRLDEIVSVWFVGSRDLLRYSTKQDTVDSYSELRDPDDIKNLCSALEIKMPALDVVHLTKREAEVLSFMQLQGGVCSINHAIQEFPKNLLENLIMRDYIRKDGNTLVVNK